MYVPVTCSVPLRALLLLEPFSSGAHFLIYRIAKRMMALALGSCFAWTWSYSYLLPQGPKRELLDLFHTDSKVANKEFTSFSSGACYL